MLYVMTHIWRAVIS